MGERATNPALSSGGGAMLRRRGEDYCSPQEGRRYAGVIEVPMGRTSNYLFPLAVARMDGLLLANHSFHTASAITSTYVGASMNDKLLPKTSNFVYTLYFCARRFE